MARATTPEAPFVASRLIPFVLVLLALVPARVCAQRFAVDGEVVGGSLSLAWETAPGSSLGLGLGLTIPQTSITVTPDTARFEEYLHVKGFYRRRAGAFEGDFGARAGISDLYECQVSDCWPGLFFGAYTSLFVGWEHVKIGARLVVGTEDEPGETPRAFIIAVTPLLVRIAFGR